MNSGYEVLERVLATLERIEAKLGQGTQSSVELSENAKGGVQLTVKVYAGSAVDEAGIQAVCEFAALKREVEHQQMEQWKATLDTLSAGAN